jgi:hypothetical protein
MKPQKHCGTADSAGWKLQISQMFQSRTAPATNPRHPLFRGAVAVLICGNCSFAVIAYSSASSADPRFCRSV